MPFEATDAEDLDEPCTHEWVAHAARMAPLIDGEEYFAAVRTSMIAARRQILIVGWELHSEVALLRGEPADEASERDGYPVTLADLLQRLVEEREGLHVHLLIWTGAALFAMEREYLPRMKRPWERQPRIRLEWAKDTPTLGSHHQKFVVVDDRVVFAGGMDLTKSRWDRHAHAIEDRRRRTPGLIPRYSKPYHDTMAVYDGEVARTLGELARERWQRTTSRRLDPPELGDGVEGPDPWPGEVEPLLRDREVFLALTQPEHGGLDEKRQVESSLIRHIRTAERLIYIETQYLTASQIADELVGRLEEEGGPEVVMVLPYGCPGVLQSIALDHERDRLIGRLREADPGGRLGVYWPTLAGGNDDRPFETSVYVHAKVMVVDDRILRIGSANLNNRSMGLDTELDAWVEADGDDDGAGEAIARFRHRSLSYLLGCDAGAIAAAEREAGSLVAAVESLRGGARTLHPFEHEAPEYCKSVPLDLRLADPGRPLEEMDAAKVLRAMAEETGLGSRLRRGRAVVIGAARRHKAWVVIGAGLLLLGVAGWATPLGDAIASVDVGATLREVRESPFGVPGVLAALVVLGSAGFPITALVVSVGVVTGSWWAAPLALLGAVAAAAPGFALGRLAPESMTRLLTRGRLGNTVGAVQKHPVLAVAALRNLPVAPFPVVNAALGMTGLTWSSYLLGTAIGMLPGVVLLTLFGRGIAGLVKDPTAGGVAALAGIVAGVVVVSMVTQRVLKRFAPADAGGGDS